MVMGDSKAWYQIGVLGVCVLSRSPTTNAFIHLDWSSAVV